MSRAQIIAETKQKAVEKGEATGMYTSPLTGVTEWFRCEAPGRKTYTGILFSQGKEEPFTTEVKEREATIVEAWSNVEEIFPPFIENTKFKKKRGVKNARRTRN